jgi:hypothetical protein
MRPDQFILNGPKIIRILCGSELLKIVAGERKA